MFNKKKLPQSTSYLLLLSVWTNSLAFQSNRLNSCCCYLIVFFFQNLKYSYFFSLQMFYRESGLAGKCLNYKSVVTGDWFWNESGRVQKVYFTMNLEKFRQYLFIYLKINQAQFRQYTWYILLWIKQSLDSIFIYFTMN